MKQVKVVTTLNIIRCVLEFEVWFNGGYAKDVNIDTALKKAGVQSEKERCRITFDTALKLTSQSFHQASSY